MGAITDPKELEMLGHLAAIARLLPMDRDVWYRFEVALRLGSDGSLTEGGKVLVRTEPVPAGATS